MKKAILGKKLGMTQVFTPEGVVIPVTVVEAGPCPVVQVKNNEKDGYEAVVVAFEKIIWLSSNITFKFCICNSFLSILPIFHKYHKVVLNLNRS